MNRDKVVAKAILLEEFRRLLKEYDTDPPRVAGIPDLQKGVREEVVKKLKECVKIL